MSKWSNIYMQYKYTNIYAKHILRDIEEIRNRLLPCLTCWMLFFYCYMRIDDGRIQVFYIKTYIKMIFQKFYKHLFFKRLFYRILIRDTVRFFFLFLLAFANLLMISSGVTNLMVFINTNWNQFNQPVLIHFHSQRSFDLYIFLIKKTFQLDIPLAGMMFLKYSQLIVK